MLARVSPPKCKLHGQLQCRCTLYLLCSPANKPGMGVQVAFHYWHSFPLRSALREGAGPAREEVEQREMGWKREAGCKGSHKVGGTRYAPLNRSQSTPEQWLERTWRAAAGQERKSQVN